MNINIDLNLIEKTSAIPEAGSMIESFRSIGYNIESAVADIIDNSISAFAKNIWIDFNWAGANTWISIMDDGVGMNNVELIQAMKPGSKDPILERNGKDLGRFGLGLKTASFSQAKQLTVLSKNKESEPVFWTWDLEYVKQSGNWDIIKYLPESINGNELNELESGTVVIWNEIDRLVKDLNYNDIVSHDKFLTVFESIKKHLSMVFHRFIENKLVKIFIKGREIEAWDPFLKFETSTQAFPEEKMMNGSITIKGYVLPHKSRIKEETFKKSEGIKGWNGQQGFYIYRNERLILSGSWLGLFRKEEHYKLSRIQIDLPNTLDSEWQIDIKKSIARPPIILRDQIKAYALKVRSQAVEVYRHRGKTLRSNNGSDFIPLWLNYKKDNKWSFKINREHPIIINAIKDSEINPNKAFETLFRFIEETIPTKSIYIKEAEEPELQHKPFENDNKNEIINLMQIIFNSMVSQGKTIEEAKSIINNLEPFNLFSEYLINLE
jgi:hypothetical protein